MKIKETICTEYDERGRLIRRTRTVDVLNSEENRQYDDPSDCFGFGGVHRASSKRIHEAIEDYYMSKEW